MRALQLVVSRVGSVVRLGGRGRIAVVVLSALIAAATLAACAGSEDQRNGMDEIRSSGVLRVGTEGTYPPFTYHDPDTDQLTGYDVDVANAVADKLVAKLLKLRIFSDEAGKMNRSLTDVQGGLLLIALIVMVVNLLVDLLYGLINPRIRHR